MNDSTFGALNLSTADDEQDTKLTREYVVKPKTLSNLSVLVKFLVLIRTWPFIYEFGVNTHVNSRQIELRNKACHLYHSQQVSYYYYYYWIFSLFSDSAVYRRSRPLAEIIDREKTCRLFAMDCAIFIDARCGHSLFRMLSTFQSLYELYMMKNTPNDYYDYRQNRKLLTSAAVATEMTRFKIFVPENLVHHFWSSEPGLSSLTCNIVCTSLHRRPL